MEAGKKRKFVVEKTMPEIPRDVISLILMRVPVKPLLRFKTVSKDWYRLISDPIFISERLKITSLKPSLLFRIYLIYRFNEIRLLTEEAGSFNAQSLAVPPEVTSYIIRRIVGSINGLICLDLSLGYNSASGFYGFAFWNPTTRHCRRLPAPSITSTEIKTIWSVFAGFGFDPINKDYKIVRIVTFLGSQNTLVEVYSWRNDSWRVLGDVICSIFNLPAIWGDELGVFIGDSLNWVGSGTRDFPGQKVVVSFDMRTEQFKLIQLPPQIPGIGNLKLMSWKEGSMAIASYPSSAAAGDDMNHFEFWVKEDSTETWDRPGKDDDFLVNSVPILSWKGKRLVVHHKGHEELQPQAFLYHPIKKQLVVFLIHTAGRDVQCYSHVESLVPVNGRIYDISV